MSSRQDQFFETVAVRKIPRIRVAGIVVDAGHVLVQRPEDEADACYSLIGGEYEVGDTFEDRLRQEFEEETTAHIRTSRYLFCVENRFRYDRHLIQQVEHYFLVTLDRRDIESREAHLSQHWLPVAQLGQIDLRPRVVRDVIADGSYLDKKHLVAGDD